MAGKARRQGPEVYQYQGVERRAIETEWRFNAGKCFIRKRRDLHLVETAVATTKAAAGEAWPAALAWVVREFFRQMTVAAGITSGRYGRGRFLHLLPELLEDWQARRHPPPPFQVARPAPPKQPLLHVDGVPGVDAFRPRDT
jgi:hypothetical protein